MAPQVVVVAVDQSAGSEIAFYNALNFIKNAEDTLHVLNVRGPRDDHVPDPNNPARDFWAEEEKRTEAESRAVLNKYAVLSSEAQVKYELVQRAGDAREEICQYCTEVEADVLVVGSRGLGTIRALLMGSVSKYCLNHAPCPVVIAKKLGTKGDK